MLVRMKFLRLYFFPIMFAMLLATSGATAQQATWQVRKASGEVWVSTSGVQQVSLTSSTVVKPGDSIRTGRNGRVLLVRGEESIMVSPNTIIGIPAQQKEALSTTITQQAGEILLEVEKRNVRHFEVTTPYLAAVVKGTQFRVTVSNGNSSVEVLRGQVEVADFKSGQYAIVLPGQTAKVSLQGAGGLSLSGRGTFNPIQQGTPRTPTVQPVTPQREALSTPRGIGQQVRIAAPLGEVKLNFHQVTKGLAREASLSAPGRTNDRANANADKQTVWKSGALTPASELANGLGQGNANSGGGNGGGGGGQGGGAVSNAAGGAAGAVGAAGGGAIGAVNGLAYGLTKCKGAGC